MTNFRTFSGEALDKYILMLHRCLIMHAIVIEEPFPGLCSGNCGRCGQKVELTQAGCDNRDCDTHFAHYAVKLPNAHTLSDAEVTAELLRLGALIESHQGLMIGFTFIGIADRMVVSDDEPFYRLAHFATERTMITT